MNFLKNVEGTKKANLCVSTTLNTLYTKEEKKLSVNFFGYCIK